MNIESEFSRKREASFRFFDVGEEEDEEEEGEPSPKRIRHVKQKNDHILRKERLTRECLRELEKEKQKLNAEVPQDVPVQILPASFRVRKWSRVVQSVEQSNIKSKNGKPMRIPVWVPEVNVPPLTKDVRPGTPALQEAYKELLLSKRKVTQNSAGVVGTRRTRNKANGITLDDEENLVNSQRRESSTVSATARQANLPVLRSPRAEDIEDVDDEMFMDEVGDLVQKEEGEENDDEDEESELNEIDDNEGGEDEEGDEDDEEGVQEDDDEERGQEDEEEDDDEERGEEREDEDERGEEREDEEDEKVQEDEEDDNNEGDG